MSACLNAARTASTLPDTPTIRPTTAQRMQALIDSFPSLRSAGMKWRGDNCRDFVTQASRLVNTYDRQAAKFICYVWNKYDAPKGMRFDFQVAIEAWDQPHIEALRAWLRDPWYA